MDLGDVAAAMDRIPMAAFVDALFECVPELDERDGSEVDPGEGVIAVARLVMRVAVALQNAAGAEIGLGEARASGDGGVFDLTWEYDEAETGIAAGRLAARLVAGLLRQWLRAGVFRPDFDASGARDEFLRAARNRALSIEYKYIAAAAAARDIPWVHLGRSLILFGQGRFQKLRQNHFNDGTSHVGWVVSRNKARTNRLLRALGLPVPRQRLVGSAQSAVRAAGELGYPVVVKPGGSDLGLGVAVDLRAGKAVRAAYAEARRYGPGVIVESFIEGDDHRLLVVRGEMIAAARRVPAHVVGNGRDSVGGLAEAVNRDPRRGIKGSHWLRHLTLDAEALRLLAEVGHTAETIPAPGEKVYLRRIANLAAGGTPIDVTDLVHPDNRRLAVWAAKAVSLDVAGIDFVTPDIARSYNEVGGGICEVNAGPGLNTHAAADGRRRDVAGPIVETFFPPGSVSRIPIAVVSGAGDGPERSATAQLLARILKSAGCHVGLATAAGVWVDGAQVAGPEVEGPAVASLILRNPEVDAAVIELSPAGLRAHGLGFERADVVGVLEATAAELAPLGIVVAAASEAVVIDGDDALAQELKRRSGAARIFLATAKGALPKGQAGAVLGPRGQIEVHDDGATPVRFDAAQAVGGERAGESARAALFAAALAHCLGRSSADIQAALESFGGVIR
jgi:cyanophycin synthetase